MTATYRKISDVVQAFRYGFDQAPEWFLKYVESGIIRERMEILRLDTERGEVYAEKGDWILLGINDKLHTRRNVDFLKQYERVTDDHMRN